MLSPDLALIFHNIRQEACAKWKKKRLFWGLDRHFQWHHEVTQKIEKCGKIQIDIRVNKLPPWLYKVRISIHLVSQIRWSNGLRHHSDSMGRLSLPWVRVQLWEEESMDRLSFFEAIFKKKNFLEKFACRFSGFIRF